jgi:hypothetical protein
MTDMKRAKAAQAGAWEKYLELRGKSRVSVNVDFDEALPEHLSSYWVQPTTTG